MKWLPAITMLLFCPAALAVTAPSLAPQAAKQPPAETQVIGGRKFFSLQNVRRYNGSSLGSPRALSVIHAPRQPIAPPVARGAYQPILPPTTAGGGAKMPQSSSDQVLSVFAPEDKRIAPVPGR